MKKYIIPTAEAVNLLLEGSVLTASLNKEGGDNDHMEFRPHPDGDYPDEFDTNKKNDNPFDTSGFWK